ncbi:MAG: ribose 5-phosphate isomerase B [Syntrophorhabdaceae bacterium]|nr:ribose 5-phosphate isomerase B [Syntrophorhabdaceae bacterium]
MTVVIGSDHAGYQMKEGIKTLLEQEGHRVIDVGTEGASSVDYPDFGFKAAQLVSKGDAERGILICGTGVGMSVVANKVKGIRASLVHDLYTAIQSRKHLDANILVLGARVTGTGLAEEIVKAWFNTPFEGGRHGERVEKIKKWELEHLK